MKSIDKLKRLTGESNTERRETEAEHGRLREAVPSPPSRKGEIDDLRRRIEDVVSRTQAASRAALSAAAARGNQGLTEILAGCEIENERGKFFLVSDIVRGGSPHGHRNIREAFDFDMSAVAMLANNPCISEYSATDALFLDTETTGLAGGTGTMAFLIGLGWFEEGHFHIRQILARDFGEEAAALVYLHEIAAQKKFLVTFNGKAFDVNLLSARFILNRLQSSLASLPHLDLLHPSRRILGHRLANSRLATLEEQVLGVEREGDIPGWEIPQRYFDWLKRRDPLMLTDIFKHNRLDVISMATLTAHLVEILTAQAMVQSAHTDDYLAAARLLLNRSAGERVGKILEIFHERGSRDLSVPSKRKLAQVYKRTGRIGEAVQIWQELVVCEPLDFYAVSELAKWLEHRVSDCERAKEIIESAFVRHNTFSEDERQSLLHRLKRLITKLEKTKQEKEVEDN